MTLEELLGSCKAEAFRLETRQRYDVGEELDQLNDFLQGRPIRSSPDDEKWADFVRQLRASGRRIYRVHIVELPLTDYLRFELTVQRRNVAAGEEIYVAVRNDHPELAALSEDWWLIDADSQEAAVALMRYDAQDRYLGFELSRDPELLDRCRRERDLALARALPLAEFEARVPIGS